MDCNSSKPWEKPLTISEILDNATNWSLASDVGLLKYLEQFAENILKKCDETDKNLNSLGDSLDNVALSADVAKTRFLSLQNSQFIENRVYEDDETEDVPDAETSEPKKITDLERKEAMKSAVLHGLTVLDKYYDKIEVPASDSEDQESTNSFILRPKDPYLNHPLPYEIGSEEWYRKWHVGLIESSSDSEAEKMSEKYSDSEADLDADESNNDNLSSGSVPKIYIPQTSKQNKLTESYSSSDNDDTNSIAYQAQKPNFAEELSAKLGNVLSTSSIPEPVVNKRPIIKTNAATIVPRFFDNEPPPLDVEEVPNFESPQSEKHGIFSGPSGLFDDDTDSLWNEKPVIKKPDNKDNLLKKSDDIFEDDDGDDLFSNPLEKKVESSYQKSKKPIGGVAVVPADLFSNKKNLSKASIHLDDSDDDSDDYFSTKPIKRQTAKPKESEIQKTKSALQPTPTEVLENKTPEDTKLIQPKIESKTESKLSNKQEINKDKEISLFSDDDNDLFDDDLFATSSTKKSTSGLFDDDNFLGFDKPKDTKTIDLFFKTPEEPKASPKEKSKGDTSQEAGKHDPVISNVTSTLPFNETKKPISIFDEEEDETDDLFSSPVIPSKKVNKTITLANNTKEVLEPQANFDFLNTFKRKIETAEKFDNIQADRASSGINQTTEEQKDITANNFGDSFLEETNTNFKAQTSFDATSPDAETSVLEATFASPTADIDSRNQSSKDVGAIQGLNNAQINENKLDEPIPDVQSNILIENQSSTDEAKYNVQLSSDTLLHSSDTKTEVTNKDIGSDISNKNVSSSQVPWMDYLCDSEEPPPLPVSSAKLDSNVFDDYDEWNTDYDIDFLDLQAKKSNEISSIFDNEPPTLFDDFRQSKSGSIKNIDSNISKKLDKEIIGTVLESDGESSKLKGNVDSEKTFLDQSEKHISDPMIEKTTVLEEKLEPTKELLKSPPKKLKHNLNINVNALLPGMGPPRMKDIKKVEKSDELFSVKKEISEPIEKIAKPVEETIKQVLSSDNSVKEVIGNVEVLQSITKDRAKPVKRRPSTRRGRQEQLRKSGIIFDEDHLEKVEAVEKKSITTSSSNTIDKEPTSNEVTKEEKYSNKATSYQPILSNLGQSNAKDTYADLLSSKIENTFSSEKSSGLEKSSIQPKKSEFISKTQEVQEFFDSDDDDLFSDLAYVKTRNIITPVQKVEVKEAKVTTVGRKQESGKKEDPKSLFGESDDDDDLFPSMPKRDSIRSFSNKLIDRTSTISVTKKDDTKHNKSLFDEDDDDFEDLFSKKKPPIKTTTEKKSLFDDETDDDDPFEVTPKGTNQKITKSEPAKKKRPDKYTQPRRSVKKMESAIVKDPLNAFGN